MLCYFFVTCDVKGKIFDLLSSEIFSEVSISDLVAFLGFYPYVYGSI